MPHDTPHERRILMYARRMMPHERRKTQFAL
jgi:hypothetical protein